MDADRTPTIQRLLTHLRDHGIYGVPEPLGIDDRGREVPGYPDGEAPAARFG